MAGIGERNRCFHGLLITNFTNQNYIRCLAHRTLQCRLKGMGVGPHFSLIDNGPFMRMHEFDGVFDGDDMAGGRSVPMIDHRCQ